MISYAKLQTRGLAACLILGAMSLPVMAQQVDYDDINREVEEYNSNNKARRGSKIVSTLSEITGITGFFTNEFPKSRALSPQEKSYIPLLKCFKKIARQGRGGLSGPQLLTNILSKVYVNESLVEDSMLLADGVEECERIKSNLKRARLVDQDISDEIQRLAISERERIFLRSIYLNAPLICQGREAAVSAAMFVAMELGAGGVKCLMSDGSVFRYLHATGGIGGLAMGFRASVGRFAGEARAAGSLGFVSSGVTWDPITLGVITAGSYDNNGASRSMQSQGGDGDYGNRVAAGLFFGEATSELKLGLRVLSKRPHWGVLIDKLK